MTSAPEPATPSGGLQPPPPPPAPLPAIRGAEPRESSGFLSLLTAAVVLLQAGLSIHFASVASVTHDEYWHLPVGVLHWKTGRFDWEVLNPPLLRLWAAIPVVGSSKTVPPPAPTPPGEYGDTFIKDHPETFRLLYFRGRLMVIALSILTSGLLIGWAQHEFGQVGGLITAVTWCLSPNTIAHGSLVTTDMAAAFGFVLVLYLLQKFAADPTWERATAWGLALGLAQGLKYTCLLLYPLCILLWFFVRHSDRSRPQRLEVFGRFMVGLFLSLVVLKLIYLDLSAPKGLETFAFRSQAATALQQKLKLIGGLPIPFPDEFVKGLDEQRVVMEQKHPVFLDNQWRESGFRSYFLRTLQDKLPLGTLTLAGLALLQLLHFKATRRDWRWLVFFTLPCVALLGLASFGSMQLGLRYVLPVLALGSLLISRVALRWDQPEKGWLFKTAVTVATVWAVLGLRYHPYQIPYFNEWVGGPIEGRTRLSDSNIDWGQDLYGLKEYLDAEGIEEIGLAYFGTLPPEAVGIKYHLPPSGRPEPGVYAISVNYLQGRPHVARDGAGGSRAINLDEFYYFRLFKPVKTIGYSIDVFRVTEADVQHWATVMQHMQRQ